MPNNYTVLIIEDEKAIRSIIKMVCENNKYNAICAENAAEAMMLITSRCPDVIVLDLGLPDMDGIEVIKKVREWSCVPIIVVSARDRERDKVEALELGADDYITKPFGTGELLARIKTSLRHSMGASRRNPGTQSEEYTIGELTVEFKRRRVLVGGEDVHLTQNEYKIVALLALNAGKIMTYDVIIRSIWGPYIVGDNQILRVNMANIRRKIEKDTANPEYIVTEIGVGYRMSE